mmetsp:Transcript_17049/g.59683  ORF Transcript_17049/g.59683 Transcript_17049/m.59683 type:complete len:207 (-) Transcript_17049:1034-1654(-)
MQGLFGRPLPRPLPTSPPASPSMSTPPTSPAPAGHRRLRRCPCWGLPPRRAPPRRGALRGGYRSRRAARWPRSNPCCTMRPRPPLRCPRPASARRRQPYRRRPRKRRPRQMEGRPGPPRRGPRRRWRQRGRSRREGRHRPPSSDPGSPRTARVGPRPPGSGNRPRAASASNRCPDPRRPSPVHPCCSRTPGTGHGTLQARSPSPLR